ncbi:methylated-DNA--[protein]-cysteine S-methyltransferase [Paenochrobactrum sp. BZR 588]|uniref:methylated-DNA--[protein]-cysteine S-methyltransferase n=1 Tax=Paenochrobactrum TaxID=999488 RepID=UPI0035BBD20D
MSNELILHHLQTGTVLDPLYYVTRNDILVALDFGPADARLTRLLKRRFGDDVTLTISQDKHFVDTHIENYLHGDLNAIEDVEVDCGGTPFQQRVWAALRTIPVGKTWSYGELAAKLGTPNAARAVGLANGLNPVSLFVPCHRVIGSNGTLTGYAGGLTRKKWLLTHEKAVPIDESPTLFSFLD